MLDYPLPEVVRIKLKGVQNRGVQEEKVSQTGIRHPPEREPLNLGEWGLEKTLAPARLRLSAQVDA
jgi:hypothetical protein